MFKNICSVLLPWQTYPHKYLDSQVQVSSWISQHFALECGGTGRDFSWLLATGHAPLLLLPTAQSSTTRGLTCKKVDTCNSLIITPQLQQTATLASLQPRPVHMSGVICSWSDRPRGERRVGGARSFDAIWCLPPHLFLSFSLAKY